MDIFLVLCFVSPIFFIYILKGTFKVKISKMTAKFMGQTLFYPLQSNNLNNFVTLVLDFFKLIVFFVIYSCRTNSFKPQSWNKENAEKETVTISRMPQPTKYVSSPWVHLSVITFGPPFWIFIYLAVQCPLSKQKRHSYFHLPSSQHDLWTHVKGPRRSSPTRIQLCAHMQTSRYLQAFIIVHGWHNCY